MDARHSTVCLIVDSMLSESTCNQLDSSIDS